MKPEAASVEHPRTPVLGLRVSAVNSAEAISTIEHWVETDTAQYVCVTGVHGVMESHRDPELRRIHSRAGLVVPDGMPLVWIARHRGFRDVDRVYGPDLMLALCASSVSKGYRHFLYGGGDGVAEILRDRLLHRFPGIRVVGTYTPPFRPLTPEEDTEAVARINQTRPDLVWVGLSTPKQERWMAAHVGKIHGAVLMGVGAAFDFHAGLKKQAPRWMQRSGLEWLYRMASEPIRLGPRYLRNNPAFVWGLVRERLFGSGADRP